MTESEKVKAIAKILKQKFTNLTVEETIDISYKILEAVNKLESLAEAKND